MPLADDVATFGMWLIYYANAFNCNALCVNKRRKRENNIFTLAWVCVCACVTTHTCATVSYCTLMKLVIISQLCTCVRVLHACVRCIHAYIQYIHTYAAEVATKHCYKQRCNQLHLQQQQQQQKGNKMCK